MSRKAIPPRFMHIRFSLKIGSFVAALTAAGAAVATVAAVAAASLDFFVFIKAGTRTAVIANPISASTKSLVPVLAKISRLKVMRVV